MTAKKDLAGQTFDRLFVVRDSRQRARDNVLWQCLCACGEVTLVTGVSLLRGHTRSCGCLQREKASRRLRTHGRSRERLYGVWSNMVQRCVDPEHAAWPYYGGRGIAVCARWLTSYDAFAADVGERPGPGYGLDRIDNDGHYEPGNVRWASRREQQRNLRNNRCLTHRGRTRLVVEWAEEAGLHPVTLKSRIKAGWDVDVALTAPARPYRKDSMSTPKAPKVRSSFSVRAGVVDEVTWTPEDEVLRALGFDGGDELELAVARRALRALATAGGALHRRHPEHGFWEYGPAWRAKGFRQRVDELTGAAESATLVGGASAGDAVLATASREAP